MIAFVAFVIVMMRPQNIAFVLAPTFLAPIVIRDWRQPRLLVAMIIGIALGVIEWMAEAYLWFGGLTNRIHLAGQEPPTFGLHFSLLMQVRTMSGPWYCLPGTCQQFYYPAVYLWWLAFFGLVALGLVAVWRLPSRRSSLLALVTAAWVGALYILLVPFGAPRYFLAAAGRWERLWRPTGSRGWRGVPKWEDRRMARWLAWLCLLVADIAVSQHRRAHRPGRQCGVGPAVPGQAGAAAGEARDQAALRAGVAVGGVLRGLHGAAWSVDPPYTGSTMKWIFGR